MGARRTQIYLTDELREDVDRLREQTGQSMAEVVRSALTAYIADHDRQRDRERYERVMRETFGSIPDMEYPSRDDWDRGYG